LEKYFWGGYTMWLHRLILQKDQWETGIGRYRSSQTVIIIDKPLAIKPDQKKLAKSEFSDSLQWKNARKI